MALDDNGKLSFSQLQTEFGDQDSQPAISLGEYYRNGPNVPTTRAGSTVVSSWPLLAIKRDPVQDYLEVNGSGIWPLYIQEGIISVRMYWRNIDATNGLCTPNQVSQGRFRGDEVQFWNWEGIRVKTVYSNYGDSAFVTSADGSRTRLYPSINYQTGEDRRDDNANPVQADFDFTGSGGVNNPFGGSYKTVYRRFQINVSSTVSTSTNINTKIPNTNNPIKFPDNYYGGTNT